MLSRPRTHSASSKANEEETKQFKHPPEGDVLAPTKVKDSKVEARAEEEQDDARNAIARDSPAEVLAFW